jgi:uncharacterized damage-inducible protein DinB
MNSFPRGGLVLAVLLATAAPAAAQGPPAPGTAAGGAAVRDDLLASYDRGSNRLLRLAEAMPEERFAWRPAEDVRSFSEVLAHVAEGNFHLAKSLGVPGARVPEPGALDRITAKDEILAKLRESIELARRGFADTNPSELDAEVEFFGMRQSRRALLLLVAEHAHEHLGQSIAYARMAGVVPPWSRPR